MSDDKIKVGAVMVVGGGISGMQSALDLANTGFKVHSRESALRYFYPFFIYFFNFCIDRNI